MCRGTISNNENKNNNKSWQGDMEGQHWRTNPDLATCPAVKILIIHCTKSYSSIFCPILYTIRIRFWNVRANLNCLLLQIHKYRGLPL